MKTSLRLSIAILILLIGAGGVTYYKLVIQPGQSSKASAPQTAIVRRGNLVISAGGAGTLVASDEKDLSFSASGEVIGVYVKPGDQVKAGTLLAEMDSSQAQNEYLQAKQKYESLTSPAAIVSAQDAVAKAQADLNSAKLQLEYLISPDVLYWETEVDKGKQDLKQAQASLAATPSDATTQQAVKKAKDFLGFAQDKLKDAWDKYYKDYVPNTFPVAVDADTDIYYTPTDLEISTARAAVKEAQTKLKESQELYNVLTGGPMPENPNTDDLIALRQAQLDFDNAQATLKGTKIIAPISGTILTVNVSVGNTADTNTAITMADLSKLAVQTYLDESDYSTFQVGNDANVVFDALPNQTFTGKVTSVDSSLSSAGGSSVVGGLVTLDPTDANLAIGMSASVEVIAEQARDAVLVPVNALHKDSSGQYSVFVMENGNPVQRNVEIGLQDLVNAEVKSGLTPGDVVLLGTAGSN